MKTMKRQIALGPDDPRLGSIDIILVSHMHRDHVGDQRIDKTNQGSCGNPETARLEACVPDKPITTGAVSLV